MITLQDVLLMPEVRRGDPVVLAGHGSMANEVRWVHSTELVDIGPLLRAGDLILTTGVALPEDDGRLASFIADLSRSGAAGLVIELGRRWSDIPALIITTCDELQLPLVALRLETRFAAIEQAVGERLLEDQVVELRGIQRVHEIFTALSLSEADPGTILANTQQIAGVAVAIESDQHQLLDRITTTGEQADFLDDWERRSRNVMISSQSIWDERNGWLVAPIGRPDRGWGRLVLACPETPSRLLFTIAERAAAAFAAYRMTDRMYETQINRTQRDLLADLTFDSPTPESCRRLWAAGIPVARHKYVGLALRPYVRHGDHDSDPPISDLVGVIRRSVGIKHAKCLAAAFDTDIRVLLAIPADVDESMFVDNFVSETRKRRPVIASAGAPALELKSIGQTLRESLHVIAAIDPSDRRERVHRLANLRVRGLLTLLRDDDRLRDFVTRELAPLQASRGSTQFDLMETVYAVVTNWESKSRAASLLRISRPVLYQRIERIESMIHANLNDPETRLSLHLAMLTTKITSDRPA